MARHFLPDFKNYASEYRVLTRLGLPVLVTQLGIIVVSFADTLMIGRYGTEELAACAFVNSVYSIPMVMLISFAGGVTPIIGALFSQKAHREAGRTLRAALQMNILTAAVMTLLLAAGWTMLGHLGQPEELMPLIRRYYLYLMASVLPMSVFNCCQQMANGVTDTSMPMWIILGTNVLNVIGNFLLIYGVWIFPEMGLDGAGLSTLFARICGAIAIYVLIRRRRRYLPYREGYNHAGRLDAIRRKVWNTSYPVMIQGGIECGLWAYGTIVCGWLGKIPLAGYQIVNTLSQLGFMTYLSVATAVTIRVANNNGLGDVDGMRRSATAGFHLNTLLATIASAIFLLGGKHILGLFTPDDEVVAAALTMLLPMVIYQYGDSTQFTYGYALRGTGNVKPLAYVSLVCYLIIGCPTVYLFTITMGLGAPGMYYAFTIALFSAAIALFAWFGSTLRKLRRKYADELPA